MLDAATPRPEGPQDLKALARLLIAEAKAQAMLIETLRHQLAGHRAHRFGSSGESAERLHLALEASEVAAASIMGRLRLPEDDGAAEPDRPRRRPIPDHIPRMTVEILPGEEACARGGDRLRRLGEDVTEDLEYGEAGAASTPGECWPAKRPVHRKPHRAAKARLLGLRALRAGVLAEPPDRAGPARGSSPMCWRAKCGDRLPLHRQSRIFAREGEGVERSTLTNWVGRSTALLEPLADAIGRHVLAGQAIFGL